jgi:TRAP-type mannitol/chloroaromatic compound transport system permease large subunit
LADRRGRGSCRRADAGPATGFYVAFAIIAALAGVVLARYYRRMSAERLQMVKLLSSSVLPMATLIVLVLGAILFGITTATESAAVGAAGAFLLALQARTLNWRKTKEAVFLTAKTTAMVCWLFVGSALFSPCSPFSAARA